MKTEKLINLLVSDLKPVKPMSAIKQASFLMGTGWTILLAYVYIRTGGFHNFILPPNFIEVISLLSLWILSSWAAIRLSLPDDTNSKLLFVFLLPAVIWTLSLFYRLWTDNQIYLNPENYHACIEDITILSLFPLFLLIHFLKSNYTTHPFLDFLAILFSSVSLAAFAVEFMCPNKSPVHLFKVHYVTAALIIIIFLPFWKILKK